LKLATNIRTDTTLQYFKTATIGILIFSSGTIFISQIQSYSEVFLYIKLTKETKVGWEVGAPHLASLGKNLIFEEPRRSEEM
jgi:hypothetical protein